MSRRGWIILGAVVGIWVLVLAGLGAVAFVAASGFGGAGEWEEETVKGDGDQKVVVIDVRGEIHGGESEPGITGLESAGARDVIAQVNQASDDPDVAALLLRIDSPGGAVVASDEIYEAVRRVEKPVVASMGDMAASGGYYVAAAAERIVAHPGTLTGSIGVIMMLPNLQGAADKLGVGLAVIKSGQFKDAGSPFRPLEPQEREHFQSLINEAYEQFLTAVSEGRDIPPEKLRPVADGRILSGAQAKERKLVDVLGDLDTAYDEALELADLDPEAARLVRYVEPPSFENLFSPFGRSPVEEAKRELGVGFGLKYLYLR